MPEFIFQMRAARKSYGDKVVLDDVTLAFLPGAKIGVVGPNGTGKSTLLRMMGGREQPSNGEARLMPGFTAGLLDQEPELDETKTVLGARFAKKPIELDIPIYITGMSFGALSLEAKMALAKGASMAGTATCST